MRSDKLVINASPVISLAKIGCADFLTALSTQLVIPEGVYQEITFYRHPDTASQWLKAQNPRIFQPVEIPPIISDWNLGKGESQVIAFALQNTGFIAVLDDRAAKNCAEVFNIDVFGTIAVIIKAKRMGLAPAIRPLLSALCSNGFRISENIIKTALRLVDED